MYITLFHVEPGHIRLIRGEIGAAVAVPENYQYVSSTDYEVLNRLLFFRHPGAETHIDRIQTEMPTALDIWRDLGRIVDGYYVKSINGAWMEFKPDGYVRTKPKYRDSDERPDWCG